MNAIKPRIIFYDDIDRTNLLNSDIYNYVVFKYLKLDDLSQLREVSKKFLTLSQAKMSINIQLYFHNPDITYKEALWYINQINTHKNYVVKSTAVQTYKLTEKQLSKIPYEEAKNPHYSCAAPMKLYPINDIINACFERHKTLDGLIRYKHKLYTRRENTIKNKSMKKQLRRDTLFAALDKIKIIPRSDSRLIYLFIEGKIDLSLEQVVTRLAQIHYLFNYTDIKNELDLLNKERNRDKNHLLKHWHDPEEHYIYHDKWDNKDLIEMAEENMNVKFPESWPW